MCNKNKDNNTKHVLKNEIHNQSDSAANCSSFLHNNLVMQYMFP
jgi:hypothetical protein